MKTEYEGLCPKCKSPAILILTGNLQGRQCMNCNAGWYLFGTNHYDYEINIENKEQHKQINQQHAKDSAK